MLHHIIVKFNENVTDKAEIASEALQLFSRLKGQNGIHEVKVFLNCVARDNRYDMMIVVDMDKESLEFYDKSAEHLKWKTDYGKYIQSKAIFDCEK